jgi:HK97 family phage prohead protease
MKLTRWVALAVLVVLAVVDLLYGSGGGAALAEAAVVLPPRDLMRPLEVKSIDEANMRFTGLASTWDLDLGGDVIEQGAFKRTLAHWRKSKKPLPLLDSHNAYSTVKAVVGKMLSGTETDKGLECEFEMLADDADSKAVFSRVKAGLVDGLSIGYRPVVVRQPTQEENRQGVWRFIKELELREISVVVWPMNEGARITKSLKSVLVPFMAQKLDLNEDERDELKHLHEYIGTLLDGPVAAPDVVERLNGRLARLSTRGLATRLSDLAARHSAAGN